jgi:hypothetical protein
VQRKSQTGKEKNQQKSKHEHHDGSVSPLGMDLIPLADTVPVPGHFQTRPEARGGRF